LQIKIAIPRANSITRTGWAAGAGIEYVITDQWSIGVDYLHVDHGSTTPTLP
jgi:outer membrane immunogenic protein